MDFLFELVSLALKPLVLAKLWCQIGARIVCIVVQTWLDVLRFALRLHLGIIWRVVIWAFAALTLPIRAFSALYRERLLEMQLYRLKNKLENAIWDRKEVEDKLRAAIKELRTMEMLLIELKEEHGEAIVKIETLEGEVQHLKDEIQRLKEVHGKVLSTYKTQGDDNLDIREDTTPNNLIKSSKNHPADKVQSLIKTWSRTYDYSQIYGAHIMSNEGGFLAAQRDIALYRTLFSVVLSLTVGLVMWEAENPCMPLVVALSTVVTISLMSALRLFENKPASDASLLSLNWFLLGTISCPLLLRFARFLVPSMLRFSKHSFRWAGLLSI